MVSLPRAAALAGLLSVGACSPTFNWRDWPVEGTPLRGTMPCKPDAATRAVPMLGTPVELHMSSCETGGLRFAIAWADIGDAAMVPVALGAWRSASLQSLKAGEIQIDDAALVWPVQVVGAPQAIGMQVQGIDPQGQPVQSRAAYFSNGSQVFQAAVYGAKLSPEAVEAFFGGLSLPTP